jgi:hypothetical protein
MARSRDLAMVGSEIWKASLKLIAVWCIRAEKRGKERERDENKVHGLGDIWKRQARSAHTCLLPPQRCRASPKETEPPPHHHCFSPIGQRGTTVDYRLPTFFSKFHHRLDKNSRHIPRIPEGQFSWFPAFYHHDDTAAKEANIRNGSFQGCAEGRCTGKGGT